MALAVVVLLAAALAVLKFYPAGKDAAPQSVVGGKEMVKIISPKGLKQVEAKIDTGAENSSIDEGLAEELGIKPLAGEKRTVITSRGRETRSVASLTFTLGDKTISTEVTLADRGELSTLMIVGRSDLAGFMVDPSREFILSSAGASKFFFDLALLFQNSSDKLIIIIPTLGGLIIFLRLIFGVRTYGIFGPIIVALSFLQIGIITGLAFYVVLIITGLAVKIFLLKKLYLPHLAEIALVMSVVAGATILLKALPGLNFFSAGVIFFPLIITSHLIERASRTVEEHRLAETFPLLAATLITAALLAVLLRWLLGLDMENLWLAFALSILVAFFSGKYTGLRLSEFARFNLLRKNRHDKC